MNSVALIASFHQSVKTFLNRNRPSTSRAKCQRTIGKCVLRLIDFSLREDRVDFYEVQSTTIYTASHNLGNAIENE